jgi:osmotically-inducible protein OsmY
MRFAALAVLAAALAGCLPVVVGTGAGVAYTTLEDRRATGVQLEDNGIEQRAAARIGDRYGDKVHVNVTSFGRTVLLTGEVPDAATREDVERVTRAVPNVRGVSNELEIAGNASLTSRGNDALVTSKLKARFIDAAKFNAVHVKVVTEAGVVFLLGIVTEREADDAVELARTLAGVSKVVKLFDICQPTDAVCAKKAPDPAQRPASPR